VFNFVNPRRAVRNGFGAAWDARFKGRFQHGRLDNSAPPEMPIQIEIYQVALFRALVLEL
jgi:hypothetical protein